MAPGRGLGAAVLAGTARTAVKISAVWPVHSQDNFLVGAGVVPLGQNIAEFGGVSRLRPDFQGDRSGKIEQIGIAALAQVDERRRPIEGGGVGDVGRRAGGRRDAGCNPIIAVSGQVRRASVAVSARILGIIGDRIVTNHGACIIRAGSHCSH